MVFYHTAVGRDVDFTIRESKEGIDGLVGACAGCEVNLYLHLCRCIVVNLPGFDFPLFNSFRNAVYQGRGGLGVRQFADDKRLGIELLDFGTHLQGTATLPIVVFRHIDAATGGEVGVESERFPLEVMDSSLT